MIKGEGERERRETTWKEGETEGERKRERGFFVRVEGEDG